MSPDIIKCPLAGKITPAENHYPEGYLLCLWLDKQCSFQWLKSNFGRRGRGEGDGEAAVRGRGRCPKSPPPLQHLKVLFCRRRKRRSLEATAGAESASELGPRGAAKGEEKRRRCSSVPPPPTLEDSPLDP